MSKKSEIWENKDDTIGIFSYECGSICIDSVVSGGYEMIDMTRDEAIAAARAILKHFNEE